MKKCCVKGCRKNAKAFLGTLQFCKEHAQELGLKGWKKSPSKRTEQYKNIIQFDQNGYPSCEEHGSLNCVEKNRQLWRCIACGVGVSFGSIEAFDAWLRLNQSKR